MQPEITTQTLRRFIQREAETRIGRALLAGDIREGATITVDVAGDQLVVSWEGPLTADEDRELVESSA